MNRIFMEVNDITDLQLSWDVFLGSENDGKDDAGQAVFKYVRKNMEYNLPASIIMLTD